MQKNKIILDISRLSAYYRSLILSGDFIEVVSKVIRILLQNIERSGQWNSAVFSAPGGFCEHTKGTIVKTDCIMGVCQRYYHRNHHFYSLL